MKSITWQVANTGGGCMVYGADFEEAPSIAMTDECIVVIADWLTFDDFWDDNFNEDKFEENTAGMLWLNDNLTIVDFNKFLTRHNLEEYLGAIIEKHRKLTEGYYGR